MDKFKISLNLITVSSVLENTKLKHFWFQLDVTSFSKDSDETPFDPL